MLLPQTILFIMLYYVPLCVGIVVYYLRLFINHVLLLYNKETNGEKEDNQLREQSTFTKGKYSN